MLDYKIEWDEKKNNSNLKKHGLDFVDFKLMLNKDFIVRIDDRIDYEEERYIGYGLIDSVFVVAIFTIREKNIFRVISFRKGNSREQQIYKQLKNRLGKD